MKKESRRDSDKITNFQVFILVSATIIGVSIISLPRTIAKEAPQGGLLAILGGGGISMLAAFVIAKLSKRFPRRTFVEYSCEIIGNILGRGLNLIYASYFALMAALLNRFFADAIKAFLLERTPVEVISITMFLVVVYLAQHGINPIVRIDEAFMPLFTVIFLFAILLSTQRFQIARLYPAFQPEITPIIKVLPQILIAFAGFEVLLFVGAFMEKPQDIVKYGVLGLVPPTLIYFFLIATAVGNLGVNALNYTLYPTLTLTKSVEFPGGFGERFDLFFFAFWVLAAFTTIAAYYYLAALTLTRTLNLRNYKPFVFLLLPITYLLSILPQNLVEVEEGIASLGKLAVGLTMVVPLILLLVAVVRKKGEKSSA